MAEPASTVVVTAALGTAALIPVITLFGIPLGLRPDYLVAGFLGSLAAITLLNSVPSTGDTWQHLVRNSFKRIMTAVSSSVVAGYITPIVVLFANVPDALILGAAFGVGAGAQQCLVYIIRRFTGRTAPTEETPK